MFKKQLSIIFIGLCVVIAVMVLGWSVFVKRDAPVQAPVVSEKGDEVIISDDSTLPDLEVKNLQYYREFNSPRIGDQIGYKFDIVNNGKVPVNGTFKAEFYCEEILLSSPTYTEYHLSPNESITVNTSTDVVFTKAEVVNFSIVIDSTNEIEESNEDNNIAYATVEVLPKKETRLPDLQIKNLKYYSPVYTGDTVYCKFDIFNNGDIDFNGDITVYYVYTEKRMGDQEQITNLDLAIGESKSIEIVSERKFSEVGITELSVMIDFWNKVKELNELNNSEVVVLNVLPEIVDDINILEPKTDISDWKTYRNEEYGFEIKYPKEFSFWEASCSPKVAEIIDVGFRPDDLQGSVLIVTIIDIPLQELSAYEHSVYGDPTDERVKVDNLAGTKFSGYCDKMIGIQKGEYTFYFSSHLAREKELVIFDQMLSTFKFTE